MRKNVLIFAILMSLLLCACGKEASGTEDTQLEQEDFIASEDTQQEQENLVVSEDTQAEQESLAISEEDQIEVMQQADSAFQRGDLETAEKMLMQFVVEHPDASMVSDARFFLEEVENQIRLRDGTNSSVVPEDSSVAEGSQGISNGKPEINETNSLWRVEREKNCASAENIAVQWLTQNTINCSDARNAVCVAYLENADIYIVHLEGCYYSTLFKSYSWSGQLVAIMLFPDHPGWGKAVGWRSTTTARTRENQIAAMDTELDIMASGDSLFDGSEFPDDLSFEYSDDGQFLLEAK